MGRNISTAIIATVSDQLLRQAVCILSEHNLELLAVADSGQKALEQLSAFRPDLLLADAQLPALDGSALLKRALCSFSLPVRPAAMLMYYPEFPVIESGLLLEAGAEMIEKPMETSAFNAALKRLQTMQPSFTRAHQALADTLLDELGVPNHPGRACLKNAALLCAADERMLHHLSGRLYPQVAEICHLEPVQVERAMRHAIDLAWQSDKFDNQYRIFANTVDAGRGQPTCGEMISRLADILHLEG